MNQINWIPFEEQQPPADDNGRGDMVKRRVLVTNNLPSRDACKCPSHVWLLRPCPASNPERTGAWVGFDDSDRMIHGLTHWADVGLGPEV